MFCKMWRFTLESMAGTNHIFPTYRTRNVQKSTVFFNDLVAMVVKTTCEYFHVCVCVHDRPMQWASR